MAEITISKEKIDYTIDLLITMITDEIAEETGRDRKEVLTDFLCSRTGKALYDEKTKLWCNGPSYIAELYMEEKMSDMGNDSDFTKNRSFQAGVRPEEMEGFL